jgi:hypothetical protein
VNRGHPDECSGEGPRLVWQNEGLIESWLAWEPTLAEKIAAGCAEVLVRLSFADLLAWYEAHPAELLSPQALRLVPPPPQPAGPPARRILQVIENTKYVWEEFLANPANPDGDRYVRMVAPQQRMLPMHDARVLLTASQRWTKQVASGQYTTYGPAVSEPGIAIPPRDAADSLPQQTPDGEAQP